jgi:peptidoglycan endopeptidase LytE
MVGRRIFCGVGLVFLFMLLGLYQVGLADERYTVKPGDSLSRISKTFGVTVEVLREANGLKGNAIKPKQILVIPTQGEKQGGEISKESSARNIKRHSGQGVQRSLGETDSYVVQKGDTLHAISKRTGVSVEEIKKINQIHSTALKIGQTLILLRQKAGAEEQGEEIGDAEEVIGEQLAEKDGSKQETSEPLGKWNNPEERSLLVRVVKTFLGAPYRLGGSTLKGLDCSAFVKKIYEVFNIHLPRTAGEQSRIGKRVGKDELEEGDLVFFKTQTRRAHNAHVGIYIGNNQFVHASSRNREVKVDNLDTPYFSSRFLRGVRVKELEGELTL